MYIFLRINSVSKVETLKGFTFDYMYTLLKGNHHFKKKLLNVDTQKVKKEKENWKINGILKLSLLLYRRKCAIFEIIIHHFKDKIVNRNTSKTEKPVGIRKLTGRSFK